MESYYSKNQKRFQKYYKENREKKVEYQREYSAQKNALYAEMKEKLINCNIVIRAPQKRDTVGITIRRGEFEISWD